MLNINYDFKDPQLLEQALTHKSFANEQRLNSHNEKLEFLGDAVLDLLLSDLLMEKFPGDDEGNLSKKRASLVNESTLAELARGLDLPEHMRMGKGELATEGPRKPRLLASAYEALLGAVFKDGGFLPAKDMVRSHYESLLGDLENHVDFHNDFKTRLQEMAQSEIKSTPAYEVTGEKGPSHLPEFEVSLSLQGKVVSVGVGRNKKSAEQNAAKNAIEALPQLIEDGTLRRLHV
jgi:ribonuclease III